MLVLNWALAFCRWHVAGTRGAIISADCNINLDCFALAHQPEFNEIN
jgi:hypothetical protein